MTEHHPVAKAQRRIVANTGKLHAYGLRMAPVVEQAGKMLRPESVARHHHLGKAFSEARHEKKEFA